MTRAEQKSALSGVERVELSAFFHIRVKFLFMVVSAPDMPPAR